MEKVVLAYSGGLDTSVAIKWLTEKYSLEVIALCVDLGQGSDMVKIQSKALSIGAVESIVFDAKKLFVDNFVFPSLRASALYEGKYPLATALSRPLIAQLLVKYAQQYGAKYVAHGCTGKGNDQVRFDAAIATLDPSLSVIAPVREWGMNRDQEIDYAQKHKIEIPVTISNPYSVDQNIWGRSTEGGILEDLSVEPPSHVFGWTNDPEECPEHPVYLTITFKEGVPIALDDKEMDSVMLVDCLNQIGGKHGVGRIDHVENRLVGIKTREIYEAPAAVILHEAHNALEGITLSKDSLRFKQIVSREYSDLVYNGKWFSYLHLDLMSYIENSQRFVSGEITIKIFKGGFIVVKRESQNSLYSDKLATYGEKDGFDHSAALGFIKIFNLENVVQGQVQLKHIFSPTMLLGNKNTKILD